MAGSSVNRAGSRTAMSSTSRAGKRKQVGREDRKTAGRAGTTSKVL